MKSFYCTKCGSPNHKAIDCSLPNGTVWTPPPGELEKFRAEEAAEAARVAATAPLPEQKLDPPRWPGGPQICTKENLPAFPDEKAMGKFMADNASGAKRKWNCEFCGCYHYEASGKVDSNGQGPGQFPTKNFKPFMREATKQRIDREQETRRTHRFTDDLPEQEPQPPARKGVTSAPEPPKRVEAPKPKPKTPKAEPSGQSSFF